MASYDWSRFVLRIPIRSNSQEIYQRWSTQDGLEEWFLRRAEFTRPGQSALARNASVAAGDNYEWRWHGWSDDIVEKGTYLEANGTNAVKFSFGKGGNVAVKITSEKDHCIVELTQDGIPTDEESKAYYHIGCMKGWNFYLTNLKSILEGGIDLRNRDESLKEVVNS